MQSKQFLKKEDREPAYQRYYNFASMKYNEKNDAKYVLDSLEKYTEENPVEFAIGGDPVVWILARKEDMSIVDRFDTFRDENRSTSKALHQLISEGHSPVKILLLMYAVNHQKKTSMPKSLQEVRKMRSKAFGYLFGGIALTIAGTLATIGAYDAGFIVVGFGAAIIFGLSFIIYALYAIPASTKAIMQAEKRW